jgi:AcrR family transcriptional regulator
MPRPPKEPSGGRPTRERILDVALDLFATEGFEKTSLREIAERMGFSKAALYYHFASKDDILLALHLRLHELGAAAFEDIDPDRLDPSAWRGLFDRLIDRMLEHRQLFILHARNHDAVKRIAHEHPKGEHEDLEERVRRLLADPAVPAGQRVRLACAVGSVMAGMIAAGDFFTDIDTGLLAKLVRGAVGDLIDPVVRGDV